MKRSLSCLLALITLMGSVSLASCGSQPANENVTEAVSDDTTAPETTTAEETTADPLADNLPDDVSYDGYIFRIGASIKEPEYIQYIIRPEQSGETLNDAIYGANMAVMERFDIGFEHIHLSSNYGCLQEVVNNAHAGEDVYDVLTMHDSRSTQAMLQGAFRDVHDLEHIDLSKPWWPAHTTESLTVNGKMYGIANSMSYYGLYSTRCLFFNKDLMTDLNIALPYDDVRSGTWYLDDLVEMTKDIYSDLDNDGARSLEDRYGIAITGTAFCFLECFGIDAYGRDSDGMLTENFFSERNVNAVEKANEWFFGGSQGAYFNPSHKGYFEADSALTMFAGGNVLFSFNSVGRQVQACMESDMEYGIVPMPKLDEEQEDYISGAVDNPVCIPITNTEMDRTGMIVEAMSAEGYRTVQPAYTETVMKERYATDKDSVEMLDIIFNGRLLAGGYLYADSKYRFQTIHDTMWKQASSNINIVSYYESSKNMAQARIDELNAFFSRTEE